MEHALSFSNFNLNPHIFRAVAKAGYETPTPIQQQAIPLVSAGRDVLGLAQTGTGKTAAFALPILNALSKGNIGRTRALVVVPTRELAQQVFDVFRMFSAGTNLHATAIYGGVGYGEQLRQLKRGSDIIVACPGRLIDHLQRGTINLSAVEILVLDEADQMFDMGFLPNIRQIVKALPRERQNLMFSATMPSEVRRLAMEILRNPETVEVRKSSAAATVTHAIYHVMQQDKARLLRHLLHSMQSESVLVFARTKHRVKKLARELEKSGHAATSLQGNLSQNQRARAMAGFRSGKYQIMVATDIAARGLDISSVSHVVNYDTPDTVDAYIHRIGRTGRAARSGDAFTLVTPDDSSMVRAIEQRLRMKIERRKIAGFTAAYQ